MSTIRVSDFVFDEDNRTKIARHGLVDWRVMQVLGHQYAVMSNRRGVRASHMLIGTDDGGTCIAVPIEPTDDPRTWRPVTAWLCKKGEDAVLTRLRRRK